MKSNTKIAALAWLLAACGSSDEPTGAAHYEARQASADEAAPPDWGADIFGSDDTCVASLKARCRYDEMETACSSIMTPTVPLSNGETWGNVELPQGPYGAYVEWNEGADFANPVNPLEAICDLAAAAFGEPDSVTNDVLDLRGQDLSLYTVFRPACMRDGETYPVITWGNGTCGQAGSYASLLATVASHGFVVFAANSRWVGSGNDEMLHALDFAKAANEDASSIYYGKLDLDRVGAMGHSQGSAATAAAASDPRIKAVILWNAGTSAVKPFLAVSGDKDVTSYTTEDMTSGLASASQPGAWLYYHNVLDTGGWVTGHLLLMEQPERVIDPAVAWWKYVLNGDLEARAMFVGLTGSDCGLCNQSGDFEFGEKDLP